MRVLDPGHVYELDILDSGPTLPGFEGADRQVLVFVKREGEMYPGNVGHHPGTTLQELYLCAVDRCAHVNGQIPDARTRRVEMLTRECIFLLEARAAERHGREVSFSPAEAVAGPTCPTCGHVGCAGHHSRKEER